MDFEQIRISLRVMTALTILTGILYPLVITAGARLCLPEQAGGRTHLIGQPFDDPKYFWSRPSATTPPYNASNSSGSNLGPSNAGLVKAVEERVTALHRADPENRAPIPVDLVTSSASGLDPEITAAAARYQVKRVARVRALPETTVRALVDRHTRGRLLGILGEPGVNVLELNLDLDRVTAGAGV